LKAAASAITLYCDNKIDFSSLLGAGDVVLSRIERQPRLK
jgi:hypothetical protein